MPSTNCASHVASGCCQLQSVQPNSGSSVILLRAVYQPWMRGIVSTSLNQIGKTWSYRLNEKETSRLFDAVSCFWLDAAATSNLKTEF